MVLYMKLSKSISYLKANTANILNEINEKNKTFIITQNGEAKAVVLDIKQYEKMPDIPKLNLFLVYNGNA